MSRPKMSKALREYFQTMGRIGAEKSKGRVLVTMTQKQRTARAKKAAKARWGRVKAET